MFISVLLVLLILYVHYSITGKGILEYFGE
jgi:hypothetical protein